MHDKSYHQFYRAAVEDTMLTSDPLSCDQITRSIDDLWLESNLPLYGEGKKHS